MSCDLCTYAQLILNKSVAFPHRGCKSRAERTTPIVVNKHHCSGGDQHGCGEASHATTIPDYIAFGVLIALATLGRGDAVSARQVITGARLCPTSHYTFQVSARLS